MHVFRLKQTHSLSGIYAFFPGFLLFFALALALPAFAAPVPGALASDALAPGALALETPGTVSDGEAFMVFVSAEGAARFRFEFRGKTVDVPALAAGGAGAGNWARAELLLSVPLDHKAGTETLRCTAYGPDGSARGMESVITIVQKKYPEQRLTVEPKYVAPPASEKARIDRERERSAKALGTISAERHWTLPFARPVPGIVTSEYGMRRVFNGVPMNPHRGVDFRSAEGTPIRAASKGRVVLAGDFYYAGNNVVVDHGLGTLTHYMHLSRIDVREGQMVERGEIIGLVGSTGRVTGPHLHLGLTVLGSSVNILPFLEAAPAAGPGTASAKDKDGSRTANTPGNVPGSASGGQGGTR